ncbi:MAG TPA: hypothetical protein PKH39_17680 [Woeseiaceae bacterium]|nr:hypothetical protein [Woeseiaceae bacterium]
MRAVLGFDGTARDLLIDLASDGGAILFVDNLDIFGDEERKTVVDLVREAESIPGFAVIATARRNFGVEELNWLPTDVLDRMGRAEPILIGELSDAEVEEIRHAAPRLAPLLADTHPARDVARNLFRLARLASRPGDDTILRTEVDMAEQWWQTADGRNDADHRERARLLRALAEQALSRTQPLEVGGHSARAVDTLVSSESLRDLGNDRVAFRHDVFREWAIANLLHTDPTTIERLPLDRPAPAVLARGVELASRMVLERETNVSRWLLLIERLSHEGMHGSWRRAVLLALVRSEVGPELLKRAAAILLENRASMLRELIRVVMAVDVEPASKLFEAVGLDPTMVPASLNVPSKASWRRLIGWLLSLGENLPAAVFPEVVNFYKAWSIGTLGHDRMTPFLLQRLYWWLTEIESTRDAEDFNDRREPFGGELDHEQIRSLESDLRGGLLLFCNRMPALAVEYLRSLAKRRHSKDAVRSILKFRGSLAQAAPAELAELTLSALVPKRQPDDRSYRREFREPFSFLDHEFLPASPAQGPFLDLLNHAPPHGLSLIHRLVDHAISFYTDGKEYGVDAITIVFPGGTRAFPWGRSYTWARDEGNGSYCITSALMALEAWAHHRIEAGENFDSVLNDVLGPPGSPAAYLLVAIDLILSHWPKSREAAVPFLSCPELLCIDRQRYFRDTLNFSDIFGLSALQREPVGAASRASLKKRHSRGSMLDQLIGAYAVLGPVHLREKLGTLLHHAAERLGPPDQQSNLGDPAFMAFHALNSIDPNNWREVSIPQPDGTTRVFLEYMVPEAESRHIAGPQEALQGRLTDANIQASVRLAVDDPSRSSPTVAAAAVEWAQSATATPTSRDADEDADSMLEQAVVGAAMIAMRDGSTDLRTQSQAWARSIFAKALQTKNDPVHRFRSGLQFNPVGMAFVGIVYLLKDCAASDDVRALLGVAIREEPAAAHGFGAGATTLASIDERLPRAVLRCAFAACIRPSREWDLPEGEVSARSDRRRQRVQAAIDAELDWLADGRSEPDWPAFPTKEVRVQTGIRLSGLQQREDSPTSKRPLQDEYVDHQAVAVWLANAQNLVDVVERPWLIEISRTYAAWTAAANGAGLNSYEEVASPPSEWNNAYFNLLAHCLPKLALPEIEQFALTPISSLPDKSFFDVITQFLRSVDAVYFNDRGLQTPIAISTRSALGNRLMASNGWKRLGASRSSSIELHIGPAIAVLFFNDRGFAQPPKCYLLPNGIDRLDHFLPVLGKLVETGPSLFVTIVTLNLFEVSPRSTHLPFIVAAAKSWLASFHENSEFWVENGIGRRVCGWVEKVWRQEPALLDTDKSIRVDVDQLLAALVSLGVPEARRMEKALNNE